MKKCSICNIYVDGPAISNGESGILCLICSKEISGKTIQEGYVVDNKNTSEIKDGKKNKKRC